MKVWMATFFNRCKQMGGCTIERKKEDGGVMVLLSTAPILLQGVPE